jgi:hypothetical protein
MSGVLQALGKYPIVFFKSEFGIIRDDSGLEIDGRLFQAISALVYVDLICGLWGTQAEAALLHWPFEELICGL